MTLSADAPPPSDSPLSRWDARCLLAALVPLAVALALPRGPAAACAGAAVGVALLALARPRASWAASRLGGVALGVLPLAVLVALGGSRGPALALSGRALGVGAVGLAALAAVPVGRLAAAARWWRVPHPLVVLALLTLRQVSLLAREVRRLAGALRARGFRGGPNRRSWATVGAVLGTLLVRGALRGERVGQAMRARGFDGTFRPAEAFRARAGDVLAVAGVWALGGAVLALDFVSW